LRFKWMKSLLKITCVFVDVLFCTHCHLQHFLSNTNFFFLKSLWYKFRFFAASDFILFSRLFLFEITVFSRFYISKFYFF
jgi:hypothetical protein